MDSVGLKEAAVVEHAAVVADQPEPGGRANRRSIFERWRKRRSSARVQGRFDVRMSQPEPGRLKDTYTPRMTWSSCLDNVFSKANRQM